MFIETIDLLRCPREHEETWLVAAFMRMNGRFVLEGSLGCPICGATYPVAEGIADFGSGGAATNAAVPPGDPEEAIRMAAFLNLVRPGSTVVLEGEDARHSPAIANITQCRVIALNPPFEVEDTELTSTVRSSGRIPLAASSVEGIAASDEAVLLDASRVLRSGARLVTHAETRLPAGLTELARDESRIVAESSGQLVRLSRSSG